MKAIKFLLFFLLSLALLACLGLYMVYGLFIDEEPRLTQFDKASVEDIRRIKALVVDANTPPAAGDIKTLVLSERDVNLGISYLGPATIAIPKSSYARVHLGDDIATVELTLPVSWLMAQLPRHLEPKWHSFAYKIEQFADGDWLNVTWQLNEKSNKLVPAGLTIGNATLGRSLSNELVNIAVHQIEKRGLDKQLNQLLANLRQLDVQRESVTVSYVLPKADQQALASYQALILSSSEQALISEYSSRLQLLPQQGPLVSILKSLLAYASERSRLSGDPIAENRAALLALAKASGGDQLVNMLNTGTMDNTGHLSSSYTIYKRKDLAQHLILSAGLTLIADERLAGLIGENKELADLNSGKTISAWDLLADRAGVRLAQLATSSRESAVTLQEKFVRVSRDDQLLPDLGADFAPEHDRFMPSDIGDLNLLAELSLDELEVFQK